MLTQIARRLAVASALLLVTVNIAAAQANYPVTVTDDAGVHTTFNAPPRRIVSLNPGHTETVLRWVLAIDWSPSTPSPTIQLRRNRSSRA